MHTYILYLQYNAIAGFTNRLCLKNDRWESPNISTCQTIEIIRFKEKVMKLVGVYRLINSDDSDMTRIFRLEDVQEIIDRLVNVINVTQPVLPNDLPIISTIMREVIL